MRKIKDDLVEEEVIIKMPRRVITKTQRKYLTFIESFYNQYRRLPTYEEIGKFFGVAKSTVFATLNRHGIKYNSKSGLSVRQI